MSEACADLDARLEAVAAAAASLPSRMPRIRDPAIRRRTAEGLDALLVNISRGRSALDLSIGEGLHRLSLGSRAIDLGYSNVCDYAREELGIAASTAEKMKRLARRLVDLSVVREAVLRGELTVRKAEIIAQVATLNDQVLWVLRGKENTVRSLQATIGEPRDSDDEEILRLSASIDPEQRPVVDEAFDCAGKLLGPTSTKMQRLQGIAEEYLGSHQEPGDDDHIDDARFARDELEPAKECLEQQSRAWADLVAAAPVKAEELGNETDPWRIDEKLKRFMRKREDWDEHLARVALRFKAIGGWEELGFASFGHYCEERLGMGERTVAQRISLERSLERMPALREALREKRISYEKARLLARHANPAIAPAYANPATPPAYANPATSSASANPATPPAYANPATPPASADPATLPAQIERAEKLTCVALRRELQANEEAQMCARNTLTVFVTVRVAELLKDTFRAARMAAKRLISVGECLFAACEHFLQTWRPALTVQPTLQRRIRARDKGFCQVRGCSRAATHVHHIIPRSRGGSDDPSNLISLCTVHHLDGIHTERMSVSGTAPDNLVWKFGLRRGESDRAAANAWLE